MIRSGRYKYTHYVARADQQAKIARHGGRAEIVKKGTFRYSPPPGVEAAYF